MDISKVLKVWYQKHHRQLPWRKINDPYKIWLSEIILQQTRVEQGLPYFNRFVSDYPTVRHLADAPEQDIMKLWQGLGYYSRARNLHAAAKMIVADYQGVFPKSFENIKSLKGIGDYTAAAIASFAYNLPHAVVDGNVYRVLARLFAIPTPIDSSEGKKDFAILAQKLLDKKDPAIHNQAIMELGALVCKPIRPDCENCPLILKCAAYNIGEVNRFPVKANRIKVTNRYFNYLMIRHKGNFYLNHRNGNDIWRNLFDLPMIETEKATTPELLVKTSGWRALFGHQLVHIEKVKIFKVHKLSHQHLHTTFYDVSMTSAPKSAIWKKFIKVKPQSIENYPIPKIIELYFQEESVAYGTMKKS
ncbi:MAG: A/G-specific adenine glycosylase [Bacteroidetes bacterium]|nr:A/G-specific adenine glycosylase [Bacteroidota bacterium]